MKFARYLPFFRVKTANLPVPLSSPVGEGAAIPAAVDPFGNQWVVSAGSIGGGSAQTLSSFLSDGATMVISPGEWSESSVPAAATQATASRAGGATIRHVARTISATINAVAAQGVQILVLRDGASGVGTILWQQRLGPVLIGDSLHVTYNVNIPAPTTGNAMTLEFTTAPAATNFNSVDLTGFDATLV